MRDGKARTLEEILAGVLETLKNNKTTVVSINSDNASVNVAALNGDLQNITNSHFIRQPCAAHTLNLAIEDTFLHNPRANRIYKSIELLVTHPPKNSIRDGYSNKLATIRWISIFDCVNFIHHHKQKYRNTRVQEVADALQLIEDEIGLENLHEIMIIVQPFLSAIERDQASIADIIPAFLKAHTSLSDMQDWLSKLLLANLVHRFTTTCSLSLPWAAYLLTGDGLEYFRNANPNLKSGLLGMTTEALKIYMMERGIPEEKRNANIQAFSTYLNEAALETIKTYQPTPTIYWKFRQILDSKNEFNKVAEEILQIPATEAACERVFSSLSAATKCERCNVEEATLNARLTVKFDCIFNRAGKVSIEKLGADPRTALKLGKYCFAGHLTQ